MLLVNLRMDAVFVKENMRMRWVAETGIAENIATIVKEYKESRGLLVSSDEFLRSKMNIFFHCSP